MFQSALFSRNFRILVFFCVSVGVSTSAYSQAAQYTEGKADQTLKGSGRINAATNASANGLSGPANLVRDRKYLGCWSSGNGNFMLIASTTLQTRNSYEPLKYVPKPDDTADERHVYLLEMLDVDKSHEMPKFVAFKLTGNDEMDGSTFDSYEMFLADHPNSKQSPWARTKCSTVRGFMR